MRERERMSWNKDTVNGFDVLLNDFFLKNEEIEEAHRTEWDKQNEREQQLNVVVATILQVEQNQKRSLLKVKIFTKEDIPKKT